MFVVDISHIWDNDEITKNFIALVPVRIQPLHNGHVELLLNLSKRFKKVIVLIEPECGGQDNPFSLTERLEMVKAVSCRFYLNNVITYPILEAEIKPIHDRINWYHELVVSNGGDIKNFVIVSGNPQILNAYKNRYKFCFIDWNKVEIDNFLLKDRCFFTTRDGNARKIREMIRNRQELSENLLLPKILEIIKGKYLKEDK